MRVLAGRGDWLPRVRIEGLSRYAFIGDSHAYGVGVAPDQTLPAHLERQTNELSVGEVVEAVNLGVSGYNLWNSWLAFEQVPQVYDGVVLVLCSNDADLFERSQHLQRSEPPQARWEGSGAVGGAVARCFDDIALFSREHSLPVAVVYYGWAPAPEAIGEIIASLCLSRGLVFVDGPVQLQARNLPPPDWLVSSVEPHPSARAHEIVGRHLAIALRQQGWFKRSETSPIGAAPGKVVAAARAMVESDGYPQDAALEWALGALAAKRRLARRLREAGVNDDFEFADAQATDTLTIARRRWHAGSRVQALIGDLQFREGLGRALWRSEEARLGLDELAFVLGTGDWSRLAAPMLEHRGAPPRHAPWPAKVLDFLDDCDREFWRLREALADLRTLAAPMAAGFPDGLASMPADVEAVSRLVDRADAECISLKRAFQAVGGAVDSARPALSDAERAHASSLVAGAFEQVREALASVRGLLASVTMLRDADNAPFTIVDVSIRARVSTGRTHCGLVGVLEYAAPIRLPFRNSGRCRADGAPALVRLHFPTLYSGRLKLQAKAADQSMVEVTIDKVDLYNGRNRGRTLGPELFRRDCSGGFVSPRLLAF